jgi:hypothetical protein
LRTSPVDPKANSALGIKQIIAISAAARGPAGLVRSAAMAEVRLAE